MMNSLCVWPEAATFPDHEIMRRRMHSVISRQRACFGSIEHDITNRIHSEPAEHDAISVCMQ